jgi:hypothetical protein
LAHVFYWNVYPAFNSMYRILSQYGVSFVLAL